MAYLADFSSRRLSSLLKTAAFQKILSSDGVEEFWAEIKLKLEQSYQLALTKMKLYSVWFD